METWCAKFRDLEGMRHCDPGGCDERFNESDADDELDATTDFEIELPWLPEAATPCDAARHTASCEAVASQT